MSGHLTAIIPSLLTSSSEAPRSCLKISFSVSKGGFKNLFILTVPAVFSFLQYLQVYITRNNCHNKVYHLLRDKFILLNEEQQLLLGDKVFAELHLLLRYYLYKKITRLATLPT